jgi:hypothetical protein
MHPLDYLRFAGSAARAMCGVNRATWSRWLRGRSRVPASVINLLKILQGGELPQGGDAWAGWHFHDGKLFDPSGQWHSPASIQGWHWARQELQHLRAKENASTAAGGNVVRFPGRRSAQTVTAELYRRIKD